MKTRLGFFRFERIPFQYALLVVSVGCAKLLHMYSHVASLPPLLFILYLPTFLALDVLDVFFFWYLVHLQFCGRVSILVIFRGLICILLLGASSAQVAFYLETGGELKWTAAKNFANDLAGIKLLLSGSIYTVLVSIFILTTARLVCQPLYHGTRIIMLTLVNTIRGYQLHIQAPLNHCNEGGELGGQRVVISDLTSFGEETPNRRISSEIDESETAPLLLHSSHNSWYSLWLGRMLLATPVITVSILLLVRPRDYPYAHMSGSLPFTLLEILRSEPPDICQAGYAQSFNPFPLPDLISSRLWEPAHDKFVGWMPSVNTSSLGQPNLDTPNHVTRPTWLPRERIDGFDRWYEESDPKGAITHPGAHRPPEKGRKMHQKYNDGTNYNPVQDPLRITNLDQQMLHPIIALLEEQEVKIRHIVLLSLESTRKDVFPFKKGSHLHSLIMKSHRSKSGAEKANFDLAQLTVNAEILTGEASGFDSLRDQNGSSKGVGAWRNLELGKGGINIVGALTGSTATLKSMLGSHCGVQPLPVDFTVEAHAPIYQPCLPSILKLFNENKITHGEVQISESSGPGIGSMPWKSVFVQAITDQFDHEEELNEHVGFSRVVVRDTLLDPTSDYYPPTEKESNYFGFPEQQVKPYLRDAFLEAEEKGERLFLSHLTSSTHHPWNTPESAGATVDYFEREHWHLERPLNRYLNTIRYGDRWVGEVMDMLEDIGVAEETLVVLVGDHGMAFKEDSERYTTFENGHITNLRVPLVFHHPSLPRIQLAINATSISIIPTILDLLIATSSLNSQDLNIATDLIQQYEGQSLIRPYQAKKNGRESWNIGVLSAGGALISVSSAAVPYRLVMPVCKSGVYRFTSIILDPNELQPLEKYSISELAASVKQKHGDDAAKWVVDAEKIGIWNVREQRRRWKYHGASLQDDRSPQEMKDAGKKKLKHWWDT